MEEIVERDYAKINFYAEFNRKNAIDSEIAMFVKNNGENSGFYELCATFLDIALNAKSFSDGSAIFDNADINTAIQMTLAYIKEHEITHPLDLLDLIYEHHTHALRKDENRPTSRTVWKNESSQWGRIGIFYDFTKIPVSIWDEIKGKIKEQGGF